MEQRQRQELFTQLVACARLVQQGQVTDPLLLETAHRLHSLFLVVDVVDKKLKRPCRRRQTWQEREQQERQQWNNQQQQERRQWKDDKPFGTVRANTAPFPEKQTPDDEEAEEDTASVEPKNPTLAAYQQQKQAWEHLRKAEQKRRQASCLIRNNAAVNDHGWIRTNDDEDISYTTWSSTPSQAGLKPPPPPSLTGKHVNVEELIEIPPLVLVADDDGLEKSNTPAVPETSSKVPPMAVIEDPVAMVTSEDTGNKGDSSWTEIKACDESSAKISIVQDWEDMASLASLSDFELISVNESPVLECKKCAFHNTGKVVLCGGCGTALVANPCVDVDCALALSLANQGDSDALFAKALLTPPPLPRTKHDNVRELPLLEQSQVLKDELYAFIRSIQGGDPSHTTNSSIDGITFPTEIDLLFQVSSFIEQFEGSRDAVALAYVFTSKYSSFEILKQGFETPPQVCQNMEVAFARRTPGCLTPVSENDTVSTGCTGFIVAITNYNIPAAGQGKVRTASGRDAWVLKMRNTRDVLPLLCFDAGMRDSDLIRQLSFCGFSRILGGFFAPPPPHQDAVAPISERDATPFSKVL